MTPMTSLRFWNEQVATYWRAIGSMYFLRQSQELGPGPGYQSLCC